MSMGPHSLSEAVRSAEPYPIQGLFSFKDFFDEIDAYYHRTHGHEYGVSSGWKTLDNFYSVSLKVMLSLKKYCCMLSLSDVLSICLLIRLCQGS